MASISPLIQTDALTLQFIAQDQHHRLPDGFVHEKIVPCTIVAQVLFGAYEITCAGRTEIIQPGEAFLTPANRLMTIVHHGDPQHGGWLGARWVHFHVSLFDTLDLTALLELPLRLEADAARPLGEIIQELIDRSAPESEQLLQWLARRHELAFAALRVLCELAPLRPESQAILQQSRRLAAVFAHIHAHIAEPVSVAHLARLTHMSRSRFHAFFREHMGCTPMEYAKKIRLNEACKSLMSSEATIAQIAERVGFCNQFHFSREFKACFSMTPSRYRKSSNSRFEGVEIKAALAR